MTSERTDPLLQPVALPPTGSARSVTIPEIEALRGLAIALVVFFHVDGIMNFRLGGGGVKPSHVSIAGAFVGAGHTGVSLFFILSGFLLTRPFLREATGGRRVERRAYFWRRALRILPAYWLAVSTASIVLANGRPAEMLRGLPYLLFLNSIPGLSEPLWPFSGVWWSLATEAQFYLLLPLLPLFVLWPAGRRAGVLLLAIYVAAYVGFLIRPPAGWTHQEQMYVCASLFGRAPLFALGGAVAWVWASAGRGLGDRLTAWGRFARGGFDVVLLSLFVLLGLLLQHVVLLTFDVAETSWFGWHLIEGSLWATILLLLLLAPLRTKRLISNAPFVHLGRWSYSLYLIHYPFFWYSMRWLKAYWPESFRAWGATSLLAAVPIAAVCVALSALSYRVIEGPFLARKGRIAERNQ